MSTMTTESTSIATVDNLNSMLRTTIASCKTYQQAIRKIEAHGDREAIALRVLLKSHLQNAKSLRREIRNLGGMPDEHWGAWGIWANAVEGVAALFGNVAAVRALKEGERHGISVALSAIRELAGRPLELVRDAILPDLARHIELLDAIAEPA